MYESLLERTSSNQNLKQMLVKEQVGQITIWTNPSRSFSIAIDEDGSLMAGLGLSFSNETAKETRRQQVSKAEVLSLFDSFCAKVRREIENSEGKSVPDHSVKPSR